MVFTIDWSAVVEGARLTRLQVATVLWGSQARVHGLFGVEGGCVVGLKRSWLWRGVREQRGG